MAEQDFIQALEDLDTKTYGEEVRGAIHTGLYEAYYNNPGGGGGGGGSLQPDSVDTIHLKNDAVKTAKINDGAVTEAKLASAVASKLNNPLNQISNIPESKLASEIVTKLNNPINQISNIPESKLASALATKINNPLNQISNIPEDKLNTLVRLKLANGTMAYDRTIGIYNVMAYRAVGDGVEDDGFAIQDCIADAAENGGGIIYFPQGTYNITRTLFYTSNMTFLFAEGATVRLMDDGETAVPSTIFAPYFDTSIAYYTSGQTENVFAVENVWFIGGTMSGTKYTKSSGAVSLHAMVILTCFCRNIHFVGVNFEGNSGGHCIEINSSTNVTVRDCKFSGYSSDSSVYHENLQIDAATCTAIGSKLAITQIENHVYYYERTGQNYSMLGGYYTFTLLPPGTEYTDAYAQTYVNEKLGNMTNAQIRAKTGFKQCCHDIEITGCQFENAEGVNCRVSAIGSHTQYYDSSRGQCVGHDDAYANQNHDKHSGILIHGNTFHWAGNHTTGSSALYRGVIAFGTATGTAVVQSWNAHVDSAVIYGNQFFGNGASTDYAISAERSGARHYAADEDFPQTKYRIYGNYYDNIVGWDTPEEGGGSVDNTVTTICKVENSTPVSEENAFLTPLGNAKVEKCKVIKFRNRIQGLVVMTDVNVTATNARHALARINQSYRPYAPLALAIVESNSPVTGFFKASGETIYKPFTGYVSAGLADSHGVSQATLSICGGVTGAIDRLLCWFEYPIV